MPIKLSHIVRHARFLKLVAWHSITAFGGPQMHTVRLYKLFSQKNNFISEEELTEYNAFVQLLPGASSTQIVVLIGFKRGGVLLAICTLFIWIFPASVLMGLLSILIIQYSALTTSLFRFIPPMAVGFIIHAVFQYYKMYIHSKATLLIMFLSMMIAFFVVSPWVYPVVILMGCGISNLSKKRFIQSAETVQKPIKWSNLWLFATLFALAGSLSELARIHHWGWRRFLNLFENFYRFGSLVFGGGSALTPMIFDQYVVRSQTQYISAQQFLIALGTLYAFPGPTFAIAAFVGGMVVHQLGLGFQILGISISTIAIFLPSFLLALYFFPIWQIVKKHVVVYRSIEGINAVVVGLVGASALLFLKSITFQFNNLVITFATFVAIYFFKIFPTVVVLFFLLLGIVMSASFLN